MKLLKIKNINKDFIIDVGKIYNVNIENLRFYHQLIFSVLFDECDYFIYSENYAEKDLLKKALIIVDPMNIDPNSKKILTSLYKKVQSSISEEDRNAIEQINTISLELLNKISLNMNLEMEYETDLDISKILSLYKFSFKTEIDDYLRKLVTYIKANLEIFPCSFIISFNLLSLLSESEIELFQKELEFLGLSLVNIQLVRKTSNKIIDSITIDDDLCEF